MNLHIKDQQCLKLGPFGGAVYYCNHGVLKWCGWAAKCVDFQKPNPCAQTPATTTNTATTSTTTVATTTTTTTPAYFPYQLLVEQDKNFCLDYNFNSGNAYAHPCHGMPNQLWAQDSKGRLVVMTDGGAICLQSGQGEKDNVWVTNCSDSPKQVWDIGDTSGRITQSGLCLNFDVDHVFFKDNNVYLNNCQDKANQDWKWAPPIFQMLVENSSNACLEWDETASDSAKGRPCTGAPNQLWKQDTGGRLVSQLGGDDSMCLQSMPGANGDVILADWCDWVADDRQQWTTIGGTVVRNPNVDGKLCLDYDNAGSFEHSNVYMHDCIRDHGQYNKSNQLWSWTLRLKDFLHQPPPLDA